MTLYGLLILRMISRYDKRRRYSGQGGHHQRYSSGCSYVSHLILELSYLALLISHLCIYSQVVASFDPSLVSQAGAYLSDSAVANDQLSENLNDPVSLL